MNIRLQCAAFWVDVRIRSFGRRWIASADTPDGPSLGMGDTALRALRAALEPFTPLEDDLVASASTMLRELA